MKKLATLASAAILAVSLAAVPSFAAETNEKVLKHTPVIDGKIDAAYMQSYQIEHEWIDGKFWGLGKFEPNEEGVSIYGNDVKATSYFLWDDDCIYLAVSVTDDDFGVIDDAHFAKGSADRTQWAPYYQDIVIPTFTYKGMNFIMHADAAGRFACVYKEANFTQTTWTDMYSWSEYEKNISEGLFATIRTNRGYNVEFKMPISENVKSKLLKDGGSFSYGLQVGDATADSKYAEDYALSLEGIHEEGVTLEDMVFVADISEYGQGKYKVKLSDEAPTEIQDKTPADSAAQTPSENQPETDNKDSGASENTPQTPSAGGNNGSSTNTSAAQTSDIGIAVAATALVSASVYIFFKRRR